MVNDTIAAVITAMGASSVGIIRLSGPEAVDIGAKIYHGKKDLRLVDSHTIHYGKVVNPIDGKVVDEVLMMVMRGPRSFTGEDIIEIQCHGGTVVIQKILNLVLAQGARLAEVGEYSKRAFLNGKMDLSQAEAIMDIVGAKTERSLDLALTQLQGGLSAKIGETRAQLLELIAFIQADIDYPDDDIERLTEDEQQQRVQGMIEQIESILQTAQKGQIIRDGLKVAIIGKPNVGKSSLMNALLGQNRAIVTDIPGTTRDVIEEYVNLNGIPLKIVDTAGIRQTDNLVEQIGVEKARAFLKAADLVLYVYEPLLGLNEEDQDILKLIKPDQPVVFLKNKMDLPMEEQKKAEALTIINNRPVIAISAMNHQGIDKLEKWIIDMFFDGQLDISQEVMVTNARHITILEQSIAHLVAVSQGIDQGITNDFLVIDCQSAWEKLGSITGDTVEEDLLDQIFSQFCLGK